MANGRRFIAGLFREHGRRLLLLFLCLLAPLWLFVELADEIHELEDFYFDDALLLQAHALSGPTLDRFFVVVSALGYQWGVVPADIALTLGLLVARRWREATFAGVSLGGSALLNMATKQFFQRDRPALWESIAPEHTFSFPSGHAMGSATLAMVVVLLCWHTRFRWPAVALAALFALTVGASRIYLGVHYPSDILGGWAAGIAWVSGVYLVLYRIRERPWQLR
ncbi:phosphatase PAP2 family protein [Pseudoxanthomonas mexicana]|uniref:phosphatase PAP2 family protein n=1 Tax=Pseudoxanthomonas mexicana TaxID=128785 RepID=UPI001FD6AE17|nr:phosphatase PAP2 family protein [Pseudoxanthomonas mexicana]UOV03420.1 phosphatase PAP2 family protein [Pseudoxanthomonas mexicana]